MMSDRFLFRAVYASILLVAVSALGCGGYLTWKGHAQLAVVLADRLSPAARAGGDETGPKAEQTRPAAVLAAMTLIFTMTQFAPPRSGESGLGGCFAVVTALVLVMFAALVLSEKRARIWPFTKLDWLAVAVAAGGLAAPLLSDLYETPGGEPPGTGGMDQWTAGLTWVQVITYLLAWFAITRCFSDPEWGRRRPEGTGARASWMGDRWRGSLASVVLLFGLTLTWGAVRAGAMVYQYQAGRSMAAAGDRDVALTRLERALELSTGLGVEALAEACLSEVAILHFQVGSRAAGQRAIRRLAALRADDPSIDRRVAEVYFEVGYWRLAAAAYEAHLHKWGADAARVRRFATACLRSCDHAGLARALTTYGDIPELVGANADEHLLLGRLFSERDDHARAGAEYTAAARARPQDPYIQFKLGCSRMAAGQLGEATRALERATALGPGFAEAAFRLGMCLEALGRDREAVESYRETLVRLPAHLGARLGRLRLEAVE